MNISLLYVFIYAHIHLVSEPQTDDPEPLKFPPKLRFVSPPAPFHLQARAAPEDGGAHSQAPSSSRCSTSRAPSVFSLSFSSKAVRLRFPFPVSPQQNPFPPHTKKIYSCRTRNAKRTPRRRRHRRAGVGPRHPIHIHTTLSPLYPPLPTPYIHPHTDGDGTPGDGERAWWWCRPPPAKAGGCSDDDDAPSPPPPSPPDARPPPRSGAMLPGRVVGGR